MTLSWKMVAVVALLIGGAIGAYALGAKELALVVAGFAGGLVPKAGAVGAKTAEQRDAALRNSTGMIVFAGLLLMGCGGASEATAVTAADAARAEVCQGLEQAVEDECMPDCGPEDFAAIDCTRAVCDLMHERLTHE